MSEMLTYIGSVCDNFRAKYYQSAFPPQEGEEAMVAFLEGGEPARFVGGLDGHYCEAFPDCDIPSDLMKYLVEPEKYYVIYDELTSDEAIITYRSFPDLQSAYDWIDYLASSEESFRSIIGHLKQM